METYFRKITIVRSKIPEQENINIELQWIGSSLGLFNQRDKDKSCFRIFIELLKNSKDEKEGLSSDELAYKLNLSRGTIVHHIHTLMSKGIVITREGRYNLRVRNLSKLIEEVQKEFIESCNNLMDVAERIDKKLDNL